MPCPAISLSGDAPLSSGLAAIDCQLNVAVAAGYGRFFGHGGSFAVALTLLLTIYVALLALGLLTGRTRLSLSAMAPRVLAIGLALTFATSWPAYQVLVYGLLTRGPDEIASAFLGGPVGGATLHFVHRLDALLDSFVSLARTLQEQGQSAKQLPWTTGMLWASGILLMLCTAGLLVVSRIVLAVLLALGPVFIVMALFAGTRGLFEGWLKVTVAFALVPMLVVLGGAGALTVLAPLIGDMAEAPATAVHALRPILLLLLGTLMYASTLVAIAWAAFALTRGWRLPLGSARARSGPAMSQVSVGGDGRLAVNGARISSVAPASVHQGSEARDVRLSGLIAALVHERGRHHADPGLHGQPAGRRDEARRATRRAQRLPGLGQRRNASRVGASSRREPGA